MAETNRDDVKKVYEIGYLLVSSIPQEKVTDVVASLKSVLSKKGAVVIAEEAPELISLAYTMIKKIGTANRRFDEGYFGWIKFELQANDIEEVKKAFEMHQDVLRFLAMTTIKENTYLGKRAPAAPVIVPATEVPVESVESAGTVPPEEKPASASMEDMDKSIDEMVKGA